MIIVPRSLPKTETGYLKLSEGVPILLPGEPVPWSGNRTASPHQGQASLTGYTRQPDMKAGNHESFPITHSSLCASIRSHPCGQHAGHATGARQQPAGLGECTIPAAGAEGSSRTNCHTYAHANSHCLVNADRKAQPVCHSSRCTNPHSNLKRHSNRIGNAHLHADRHGNTHRIAHPLGYARLPSTLANTNLLHIHVNARVHTHVHPPTHRHPNRRHSSSLEADRNTIAADHLPADHDLHGAVDGHDPHPSERGEGGFLQPDGDWPGNIRIGTNGK